MTRYKKLITCGANKISITRNLLWGHKLYKYYKNVNAISEIKFLSVNFKKLYVQKKCNNKSAQIIQLIQNIDIVPIDNSTFFYSIDCFKTVELQNHILDNYSVDYNDIVHKSFKSIKSKLLNCNTEFAKDEIGIIDALHKYLIRCKRDINISKKYNRQLDAIESLFIRPSQTLFEGLQRVLFFNQFLWQTRHKHNGFGHLDWILITLYQNDINTGRLTEKEADDMLQEFFLALHERCWFKSTMLLGDTGQIIILGGLSKKGVFNCNELTYKFIEIALDLKLPDPKVLLRCSTKMPDRLLRLAIRCIATGIGAPFLSNDDVVIPALVSFGYDEKEAYNYATSACWEPLILNSSCDQNNIRSINFSEPFVRMLDTADLSKMSSLEDVIAAYKTHLKIYLNNVLSELSGLIFEKDPLISLLSNSAIEKGIDIVRGGAKHCNLGVTSVGMGTVINSLINIEKIVFKQQKFSLKQLNDFRKNNFIGQDELISELKNIMPCYGCDDSEIINLTKRIMDIASEEFKRYSTRLGGKFKFGLSSPNFIVDANRTAATLDGRRNGEPFSVHISSDKQIPITELLSFAMQLDYTSNKMNGNVVDFIVTPAMLEENEQKFLLLLKASLGNGLFQLQMNVVDSKTLIAAKENPELFPNLVVRVWGFSAYFKDLPEEYKNLLIMRALENEKAA